MRIVRVRAQVLILLGLSISKTQYSKMKLDTSSKFKRGSANNGILLLKYLN